MKSKHPEVFFDPGFVLEVLQMLATFRFRLSARRLVHSLIENAAFTPQVCRDLPWDDSLSM